MGGFVKLIRRYKYLEKMLTDEMKKILVFLRGFSDEHRTRLATLTAIWLSGGLVPPITLPKKSGLESQLEQLFPANKRNSENVKNSLINAQLEDVVSYLATQENAGARKDMQRTLRSSISAERPVKKIIEALQKSAKKHGFLESEAVTMIWSSVMSAVEWNKKEDLILEQALKHLA